MRRANTIVTDQKAADFWINSVGKVFAHENGHWMVAEVAIKDVRHREQVCDSFGRVEYICFGDEAWEVTATITPYYGELSEAILITDTKLLETK